MVPAATGRGAVDAARRTRAIRRSAESGAIFFGLIFVPILYIAYLISVRISFELIAVVFRMADDLRAIRHNQRG